MGEISQGNAPIYEALERLRKMRVVPFDVPGHKRGRGNPELARLLGEKCMSMDVNSMKPLDNLCHPVSVIREAEEMAAEAFGSVLPGMQYVVSVSLILFALTSLMSQWYFGHVSLTYLKKPSGAVVYRVLFPVLILLGSMTSIELVWSIQDCALGLLILPNVAALLWMAPKVRALTKEFFDPANGYLTTEHEEIEGAN